LITVIIRGDFAICQPYNRKNLANGELRQLIDIMHS
jgi:hypothetical protein